MFKNLVDIKSLSVDEIEHIISLAEKFEKDEAKSHVQDNAVAFMFLENSTRTRFSFEIAARRLGVHTLDFGVEKSSFSKGESYKDTFENLYAIGINAIIIRHPQDGIIKRAIEEVQFPLRFVNAGEGKTAHPTQALLDFYTMKQKLKSIEGKKIVIIGDVFHSRVFRSNISLLSKYDCDLHVCSPSYFKPEFDFQANWTENMEEALKDADVVMALRVQKERFHNDFPEDEYIKKYQLNTKLLEKYAPKAILMHPGPVNRGLEITSELLDSLKGQTILTQARNGVFIRMAVLETILRSDK